MQLRTRKVLDRSFSGFGFFAIIIMGVALLVLLTPIYVRGMGAFFFQGTIEFRKFQLDLEEEKIVDRTYRILMKPFHKRIDESADPVHFSLSDDLPILLQRAEELAGDLPKSHDAEWMNRENLRRRQDAVNKCYFLVMSHFDQTDSQYGEASGYTGSLDELRMLIGRMLDREGFDDKSRQDITARIMESNVDRIPVYDYLYTFEKELDAGVYDDNEHIDDFFDWFDEIDENVHELLGLMPLEVEALQALDTMDERLDTDARRDILERVAALQEMAQANRDAYGVDAVLVQDQSARLAEAVNTLLATAPAGETRQQKIERAMDLQDEALDLLSWLSYIIETDPYTSSEHGFYGEINDLQRQVKRWFPELLDERMIVTPSASYGRTRWDGRAKLRLHNLLYREEMTYPVDADGNVGMGEIVQIKRAEDFAGTSLEPFFAYMEKEANTLLHPRFTFYWRFLTDPSKDSHMLGGIWAEILGTIYLTIGSMLFAVPLGVIAAIYLAEYAPEGRVVSLLRTFISTLAGVPSIVFGLFGLAFFINTLGVSDGRSVLAGSMTLAILILPTIIRASEEAIRSVPHTYKEAALSLGASRWHTVSSVILPAALPGILTGIVISMGRAAGETAPIIFTAAISFGDKVRLGELLTNGTRVLSWNIYNLASEHPEVDEIRHVQYGMVMVLISLVVLLNLTAIIIRARISRKLRG